MVFPFICAIIAFFGVINMQVRWYRQGKLAENSFVSVQVFIWSFLILTGCLSISSTLVGIIISAMLFFLCLIFGFPAFRWFYWKFIPHKS